MGDILFLAHRVPYPPDRGDKIRSFHLLKAAAALARVHLAAFADSDADTVHAEALRPLVASLHVERRSRSLARAGLASLAGGTPLSVAMYAHPGMAGAVARLLRTEPVETILGFSGQVAQFVPEGAGGRRFVMDFVDVDSAKFGAYADRGHGPKRWLYRREAALLARYEAQVAARADLSLFVSEAEASLFRARNPVAPHRVRALENGIDLDHFRPDADFAPLPADAGRGHPLILFTGQMDYFPNVEAVTDFAARMPLIRQRFPGACFAIVGRRPVPAVRRLGDQPGVLVTGEVADVRPWLAAATVVVAPLGIARGVQNKVLEAMAMGRPVVASPAAFEGIDAEHGRDLIVADDAAFTGATVSLLDQAAVARRIGRAARAQMVARYAWDARLAPLREMLGIAPHAAFGAAA